MEDVIEVLECMSSRGWLFISTCAWSWNGVCYGCVDVISFQFINTPADTAERRRELTLRNRARFWQWVRGQFIPRLDHRA